MLCNDFCFNPPFDACQVCAKWRAGKWKASCILFSKIYINKHSHVYHSISEVFIEAYEQ